MSKRIRQLIIGTVLTAGLALSQENPCWQYWPGLDCDMASQGCGGCHYLVKNCTGSPGCVWCNQACTMNLTTEQKRKLTMDMALKAVGNPSLLNEEGKRWAKQHKGLPKGHPVVTIGKGGAKCTIQQLIQSNTFKAK